MGSLVVLDGLSGSGLVVKGNAVNFYDHQRPSTTMIDQCFQIFILIILVFKNNS